MGPLTRTLNWPLVIPSEVKVTGPSGLTVIVNDLVSLKEGVLLSVTKTCTVVAR